MKILVTGGGTGGHVQPALAVISELRRRDPNVEVLYVGSANGIESKLAAQAGVPFRSVATGKLRRSSKGLRGMLTTKNLTDAGRVPVGIAQSLGVVRSFQPDVILGTGGYVSVPIIVAGGLLRRPVLTHEQTVTIGLANRLAGRFATRIALSFEESRAELPKKLRSRAIVTGNPLRDEVFEGSRREALLRFGFEARGFEARGFEARGFEGGADLPCVYVTGGVQGSRMINHAVRDVLVNVLAIARVLHQCGDADAEEMQALDESLPPEMQGRYVVRPFIERYEIGDAYALADVVVGRSGAGTVAELAALGKPAVFVPLEPSSKNEQVRNAQRLASGGAAVVVRQSELSGESLLGALRPLIDDPAKREAMGAAMAPFGVRNATDNVVNALLALATP